MKRPGSIFEKLKDLHRWGVSRFGGGGWAVVLFLVVAVVTCASFACFSQNPWDRDLFERLRNRQPLSVRDTIVAGFWLASVANVMVGLGLLALVKFWGRKTEPLPETPSALGESSGKGRRVFWIAVLLAIGAAAWIRGPRLNDGLWNDEELAFRKFTWGQHLIVEENGLQKLEFQPAGWDRAVFYSITGNNHVFHTVAAKVSHGIWRTLTGAGENRFSESVIRTESFVSGLLTILALAGGLRSIGFPVAGVASAWLLAFHPWHVRYSVEARGYASLLLFVVLAFLFLRLALRTGRWRWWLAFGAAQCLYLLCSAAAVYLAVAMNGVLLAYFVWKRNGPQFWRWLVANAIGAMIFLQIMTTAVIRLLGWLALPEVMPVTMEFSLYRDFWTHLSFGIPWMADFDQSIHHGGGVLELTENDPVQAAGMKLAVPLLMAAGVLLGIWKSRALRFSFGVLIGAVLLIWAHTQVSHLFFFSWYALYTLIGFVAALAVVPELIAGIVRSKPGGGNRLAGAAAGAVLIVIGYGWLSHVPRARLRTFERQPMRAAVAWVRGEAPAFDPVQANLLTASVGSGANQIRTYDPWIRRPRNETELDELIAEARLTGKPLVVYSCGPLRLKMDLPGFYQKLEDEKVFSAEAPEELKGLEGFWSYRIYRLKKAGEIGR